MKLGGELTAIFALLSLSALEVAPFFGKSHPARRSVFDARVGLGMILTVLGLLALACGVMVVDHCFAFLFQARG